MKLKPHQQVSVQDAEARALAVLPRGSESPVAASTIAAAIWPDHGMKAQGAGGAATRILKRLEKRGLCRWMQRGPWWGWHR